MVKFAMFQGSAFLGFDGVFCKETEKAVCYTINNRPVWFPKKALKQIDENHIELKQWFGLNDYQFNTIVPVSYRFDPTIQQLAVETEVSEEPAEDAQDEPKQVYTAADFPHLGTVAAKMRAEMLNSGSL